MESNKYPIETPFLILDQGRSAAIRIAGYAMLGDSEKPADITEALKEIRALTPPTIPSPDAMRQAIYDLFGED